MFANFEEEKFALQSWIASIAAKKLSQLPLILDVERFNVDVAKDVNRGSGIA